MEELSIHDSTELIVGFVHQTQSLVANPRYQCPVNGYRVPLESFRVVDTWDFRTGERPTRRCQNCETVESCAILPVTPETIMHHPEGTSGPFVIVRETFGEEELHDSGPGGRLHPDK